MTYLALFVAVAAGALVPVIPTGALVGSAAALAVTDGFHPLELLWVLVAASVGAFLGDTALLAVLRWGTGPIQRWYAGRVTAEQLAVRQRRLAERPVFVLVLSRVVPGGRIPVMLAAVLTGQSWRWFLVGDSLASVVWALLYAGVGVLGGSLFDEEWQALVLVIGLVVLIGVGPGLVTRLRRRSAAPATAGPGDVEE